MGQGCSPWEEKVESARRPVWASGLVNSGCWCGSRPAPLKVSERTALSRSRGACCLGLLALMSGGGELGIVHWDLGASPV